MEYTEYVNTMTSIRDVFYDNFKEENVDFKFELNETDFSTDSHIEENSLGSTVLIHYDKLTISNEYDKKHDIFDLFVKVTFDCKGFLIGTFTINRSTFTYSEIVSNYMHSHCSTNVGSNITKFLITCLGIGPIRHTCITLNNTFDLDILNLFCIELDKYVHIESLKGGPYRRIEHISNKNIWKEKIYFHQLNSQFYTGNSDDYDVRNILNYFSDFILYIIEKNVLNFVIDSIYYKCGMSFKQIIITLTNALVLFNSDNDNCLNCNDMNTKGYLINAIPSAYGFEYLTQQTNVNISNILLKKGTPVVTFKNKEYLFEILETDDNQIETNQVTTLNPIVCQIIVEFITEMKNLSLYQTQL